LVYGRERSAITVFLLDCSMENFIVIHARKKNHIDHIGGSSILDRGLRLQRLWYKFNDRGLHCSYIYSRAGHRDIFSQSFANTFVTGVFLRVYVMPFGSLSNRFRFDVYECILLY